MGLKNLPLNITITYRYKDEKNKYHKINCNVETFKNVSNEFKKSPKYNDIVYISIKSKTLLTQYKYKPFSEILWKLPSNLEGLKIVNILFCRLSEYYDYLPESLRFFDNSQNNMLATLDFDEQIIIGDYNLTTLNINDCKIYKLPNLPRKLTKLSCHNTNIKELTWRQLPDSLKYLDCSMNFGITKLTELPINLIYLNCSNTSVRKFNEKIFLIV